MPEIIRMNRDATNMVRHRYGQFYRFLKNYIRSHKEIYREPPPYINAKNEEYCLTFDLLKIFTAVMPDEDLQWTPLRRGGLDLTRLSGAEEIRSKHSLYLKPAKNEIVLVRPTEDPCALIESLSSQPYMDWLSRVKTFLSLIDPEALEENTIERYNQALNHLVINIFLKNSLYVSLPYSIKINSLGRMADEIIFKYHSEEVFEWIQVDESIQGLSKYYDWVTRDRA